MAKKATGIAKVLRNFDEPIHQREPQDYLLDGVKTLGRKSVMGNTMAISRAENGLKGVLDYIAGVSADQEERERDMIDDAWGYVISVVGSADLGALPAPVSLKEFKCWLDLFNLNSRQAPIFRIETGIKNEDDTMAIAKTDVEREIQRQTKLSRIVFTTLGESCIPSNFYKKYGYKDTDTLFLFLFCLRRGDMGSVNDELRGVLKDHFLSLAFIRKTDKWLDNWKNFWGPVLNK